MSETKINTFKDEKGLEKTMLTWNYDSTYDISKSISLLSSSLIMPPGFHWILNIKRVIFNEPATIVLWKDGTKTVVKCGESETFDKEKGLAMAIAKKALGNKGNYFNVIKKYTK